MYNKIINRVCKCGCGASINHKHPNAKFLNKVHKDNYWNAVNTRGTALYNDTHIFDLSDSQ